MLSDVSYDRSQTYLHKKHCTNSWVVSLLQMLTTNHVNAVTQGGGLPHVSDKKVMNNFGHPKTLCLNIYILLWTFYKLKEFEMEISG